MRHAFPPTSGLHPDWAPPIPSNLPTLRTPATANERMPAAPAAAPRNEPAALPAIPLDDTDAEDLEFRAPFPGYVPGSLLRLTHAALPLRHRIYAKYCQGHSISDIARLLRLDRDTVARHIHSVEATLLAQQSPAELAASRLRAIAAQQAILAAAWDGLADEEALEADNQNQPRYRAQRAPLLAVATRAARTIAQLQGLFAPDALQAAVQNAVAASLRSTAPSAASSAHLAPGNEPRNTVARLAPTPPPALARDTAPDNSAAFCCMPASPGSAPPGLGVAAAPRPSWSATSPHRRAHRAPPNPYLL